MLAAGLVVMVSAVGVPRLEEDGLERLLHAVRKERHQRQAEARVEARVATQREQVTHWRLLPSVAAPGPVHSGGARAGG